jgi:hypothetical protein
MRCLTTTVRACAGIGDPIVDSVLINDGIGVVIILRNAPHQDIFFAGAGILVDLFDSSGVLLAEGTAGEKQVDENGFPGIEGFIKIIDVTFGIGYGEIANRCGVRTGRLLRALVWAAVLGVGRERNEEDDEGEEEKGRREECHPERSEGAVSKIEKGWKGEREKGRIV